MITVKTWSAWVLRGEPFPMDRTERIVIGLLQAVDVFVAWRLTR